ncbi:MAG: nucleotidyltransferase domain-containing protein [Proteobacteria bacterium]|nr:nucleotidyltransferase domain-containing protein [Pseudomonadota bacterium]
MVTSPPPLPNERLRRLLRAQAADRRLLHVAVLGPHGCGFGSAQAPFELKGIYIEPTENLVGLLEPPRATNWVGEFEGLRVDYSACEVGHALRALLRGDGSVLERILAPEQLVHSAELATLRSHVAGVICQRYFGHYSHLARSLRALVEGARMPSFLHVLGGCRAALTGGHLLRSGELLLSLPALALRYDLQAEVGPLIEQSRRDDAALVEPDGRAIKLLLRLQAFLEESSDLTDLPPDPLQPAPVEQFLLELRRRFFDAITVESAAPSSALAGPTPESPSPPDPGASGRRS